ncbi:MAG: hypothetical protein ACRC5C_07000 [Bacilli bacterium]
MNWNMDVKDLLNKDTWKLPARMPRKKFMKLIGVALLLFFAIALLFLGRGAVQQLLTREIVVAKVIYKSDELSEKQLSDRINAWQQTPVRLKYQGEEFVLSEEVFQFNTQATMQRAKESGNTDFVVSIFSEKLMQQLEEVMGQRQQWIAMDELVTHLERDASTLVAQKEPIRLYSFVRADMEMTKPFITQRYPLSVNTQGVLGGKTIKIAMPSQNMFSFQEQVMKEAPWLTNTDSSLLATYLYHTLLHTNFSVAQRNIHSEAEIGRVPARFLGYDVRIDEQSDLKMFNANAYPYRVELKEKNGALDIAVYGTPFEFVYKPALLETEAITTEGTVTTYGAEGVAKNLAAGYSITVVRRALSDSGSVKATVPLGEDYYPPTYKSIIKPYLLPVVELPFDIGELDENLNQEIPTEKETDEQQPEVEQSEVATEPVG